MIINSSWHSRQHAYIKYDLFFITPYFCQYWFSSNPCVLSYIIFNV